VFSLGGQDVLMDEMSLLMDLMVSLMDSLVSLVDSQGGELLLRRSLYPKGISKGNVPLSLSPHSPIILTPYKHQNTNTQCGRWLDTIDLIYGTVGHPFAPLRRRQRNYSAPFPQPLTTPTHPPNMDIPKS
jgi:hypothetical protein